MTLRKLHLALYSLLLTNWYGYKTKKLSNPQEIKKSRLEYAKTLLDKLKISVGVKNPECLRDWRRDRLQIKIEYSRAM